MAELRHDRSWQVPRAPLCALGPAVALAVLERLPARAIPDIHRLLSCSVCRARLVSALRLQQRRPL